MNFKQTLASIEDKLKLDKKQKKELEELSSQLIFLNILDQTHDLLSPEQRDKLMSLIPTEKISKKNMEEVTSLLKEFDITQEKAKDMLAKAQEFALAKIQE